MKQNEAFLEREREREEREPAKREFDRREEARNVRGKGMLSELKSELACESMANNKFWRPCNVRELLFSLFFYNIFITQKRKWENAKMVSFKAQ